MIYVADNSDYILLIDEVEAHPHSMLSSIIGKFPRHSVVRVSNEKQLMQLKTKPIFSDKYLIVFDSFYTLKHCLQNIKFSFMFPVYIVKKREYDDVLLFCKEKGQRFKVLHNPFTKKDAADFLTEIANTELSDGKIKTILARTGTSPMRIITAVAILDSCGYTMKNIKEYIEKSMYVSTFDIVFFLLKQHTPKGKIKAIYRYISEYRSAYPYIKEELIVEIDFILSVFNDILNSVPETVGVLQYISETPNLTANKYHIKESRLCL